jgi:hypothetical protein
MSGHPEREGGEGGGQPCSTETQILPNSKFQIPSFRVSGASPWVCRGMPKSRFHVSKCVDSRILLCKFQIPSFRVSGAPPWVRRGIPKSRYFHVSSWADSRILLCKFQIPRFRVCRFQDTPGHIPDSEFPSFRGPLLGPSPRRKGRPPNSRFRVSEFPRPPLASSVQGRGEGLPNSRFRVSEFPRTEGPSWVQAQRIPRFQIPCFRVSEDPSWVRAQGTPKFQIPSFRVSEDPSWVALAANEGPTNFRVSIPRAYQRREHRFQDTERSFYFRSCTLT